VATGSRKWNTTPFLCVILFFFLGFSCNGLLGFFFFFSWLLPPRVSCNGPSFCACTGICIYSTRIPSRVRNKVSIKLILFFEVWIWLRIKFESGQLSLS
jgi:hypothetical protein